MPLHVIPDRPYSSRWAMPNKAGSPSVMRYREAVAEQNQYDWPDLQHYSDQALQYSKSPWVYVAVSKIAQVIAQSELDVFRRVGERLEPIENHPIELLLQNPSPEFSRYELIESTIGFRELTGNAYWLLDGIPGGNPDRIYPLRPDRVRVVAGRDASALVGGYVYTLNGLEIPFNAEEVIHFRGFNPLSDYYGLSAMEAAALAVFGDKAMAEWNRNFFGPGMGLPAGVVNIKRPVTEMEFDRIRERWNTTFGTRQRKTAFLVGDEMEYVETGLSHRDMDFGAGRDYERKVIFDVFGVPPGMLDPNATEANATAAKETFLNDTIWPKLVAIAEKLTLSLCPFWGADLVVRPKEMRQAPAVQLRSEMVAAAPYLSINEVRQQYYGKEPVVWGDAPASGSGAVIATGDPVARPTFVPRPDEIPANVETAQAREDAADSVPNDEGKAYLTRAARREIAQFERYAAKGKAVDHFVFHHTPDGVALALKAYADVCEGADDYEAIGDGPEFKAAVDDPFAKLRASATRQLKQVMTGYLEKLQSDILSGVRHVGGNPKALQSYFNARYWADTLRELTAALVPVYADVVDRAAGQQAERMELLYGLPIDPAHLGTFANEAAVSWAQAIIPGLVDTTRDGLLALINRASLSAPTAKGGPGDWLKDLLDGITNSPLFSAARGAVVAISEAARGIARGVLGALGLVSNEGEHVPLLYDAQTAAAMIPLHVKCDCYWEEQPVYRGNTLAGLTLVWRHPKASNDTQCARCEARQGKTFDEVQTIADKEKNARKALEVGNE